MRVVYSCNIKVQLQTLHMLQRNYEYISELGWQMDLDMIAMDNTSAVLGEQVGSNYLKQDNRCDFLIVKHVISSEFYQLTRLC